MPKDAGFASFIQLTELYEAQYSCGFWRIHFLRDNVVKSTDLPHNILINADHAIMNTNIIVKH